MSIWRLIKTPASTGAWNMAVDEAILEHIYRGESKPTLRLYAWNPPCLSLGHAQPFKDVDVERLKSHGWDVVRRVTGGRAILHTDELTYSVTGNASDEVLAGGVLESYNRLSKALLYAVQSLSLPVQVQEGKNTPASQNLNPVCFEVPSSYEITVDGKKLIGSAQARKKEGVLQHGSLPLTGDLTRICDALFFENESARQEAKDRLLARATTVESVLGINISWDTAANVLIQGFEKELGIEFEIEELSQSELNRAEELVKEKYGSDNWAKRS
ncbi:MAG: lipoate--protein ligase family protein [Anaerolineales bacterium]|nr:lipoate--protein ligase family protein [Anaerolineales bacterium]